VRTTTPRVALLALLATLACAAVTVGLFRRAYPLVDVALGVDRAAALRLARAVAAAERLAPPSAEAAVAFGRDDSLATYVDRAAGGPDSVRALARGGAVPLYGWGVRLYTPGRADEVTVRLTPDGRPAGVQRSLPEDARRPDPGEDAGRAAALAALARLAPGLGGAGAWAPVSASYVTQPRSGRVDRTYRFARVDAARPVRVGAAPVRAEVVVTGDSVPNAAPAAAPAAAVLGVRVYAEVPEAWARSYAEARAANDQLAALVTPALLLYAVGAVWALVHFGRQGLVRWRPAAVVGGTVGVLMTAAGLNALPLAWLGYDTAQSPAVYLATQALAAVVGGALSGLWVALTVAAAEALTRRAFPRHYDWYAYPRAAGAPPVAARLLGGYALAAFGFAYVTLFYLTTRSALGWWVPTESLDNPNAIATPLPWVSAIGTSLFAGTWEEALFRAVPLALLSLWVRDRPGRRWYMAAGVVVTALAFGFGHANYPSFPAYSRGVELFAEAALWAVLYLRVGLPTTIVAHALYDLGWFGLFALHGRGPAYRTSAAAVLLAAALPALVVAAGWWRARRAAARGTTAADAPRLGDWRPEYAPDAVDDTYDVAAPHRPPAATALPVDTEWGAGTSGDAARPAPSARPAGAPAPPPGPRRRLAALVVAGAALLAAVLAPPAERAGPAYSAAPAAVARTADSALRARGVDPARWDRTQQAVSVPREQQRRFFRDTLGRNGATAAARRLAGTYLVPALWDVRYVRRRGTLAERGEEWRVSVLPDGTLRRVSHAVPDAAPGAAPTAASARGIATAAARAVAGAVPLREVALTQQPRPARLDTHAEFVDESVTLPGGATARVLVDLAGTEVLEAGRQIRLPEAWLRRDADRSSRRALAGGLAGLLLGGGAVTLLARGVRRRPDPARGPVVTRRVAVLVGVAAALATLAASVNQLPLSLADWPTSTPWPTFVQTVGLGVVLGAAVFGLAAGALWALGDALRRRAGVPFWSAAPGHAVLAGVALGAAPVLAALGPRLLHAAGWPAAPATALDQLAPWATGLIEAARSPFAAPAFALPALVLAAGLRTARARLLALAAAALVGAAAAALVTPGDTIPLGAAAGALLGVGTAALVAWTFGRDSAVPWLAAPVAAALVDAISTARLAANPQDRAAGVLGVATALAVLAALHRWAAAHARQRHPGL
jgi:hypothetical protein